MPGNTTASFDRAGLPGSSQRDGIIQQNQAVLDLAAIQAYFSSCLVGCWNSASANSLQALGRGSTDTNICTGAVTFSIFGVPVTKAAVTAGTALGALGTIPASTWGIIAVDVVAAGTLSYVSGAANYTTGYATEALAIAALPARVTAKARLGYFTVLATSSTWVTGTDALAGGASGNPATTTNYYPQDGIFCPTGTDSASYTAGRNGIMIATVLSKGGTDTNLQSTAFTYNARGITDIAKAAVAAGTAFGALGTIPASKWGLIVAYINSVGTITFQSAPLNYTTGYGSEAAAIADLPQVTQPANLCRMGYVTIKASASTWIAGTDALAGGASGNPASTTNYYPQAGISVGVGLSASRIGNLSGAVITA